ncbi:MAG: ribosome silencing factor [Tannerella sp.]|nr:ribosome silencing factor [Tannerella sp.]
MDQTKSLVEAVVRGLQEKKGKKTVKVDLSLLTGAICEYMIVCEGSSLTQLSSLTDSVWEVVRRDTGEKPLSIDGGRNSTWIGIDYGTVIVHIFMPEQRAFYNIETLWADSVITEISDNE